MRRRVIKNTTEKSIITGLIVNSKYGNKVIGQLEANYFEIDYARTVFKWLKDYYNNYRKAPESNMRVIYDFHEHEVTDAEYKLIHDFLITIDYEYDPAKFNLQYLINKTNEFIKKNKIRILHEQTQKLYDRGDYNAVVKKIWEFRNQIPTLDKPIDTDAKSYVDVFSVETINKWRMDKLEDKDLLFKLDGALGNLIGPFRRNNFVSFTAPENRGKTWILDEIAIQAVTNRLRTLYISCEMSYNQKLSRLISRITAQTDERKFYTYPVFDCLHSQTGTCKVEKREPLYRHGTKPEFNSKLDYETCTKCRGTKRYITAYWFEEIKVPKLTQEEIKQRLSVINREYGEDLLRLECFPAFDASADDIEFVIDSFEIENNWLPDVLVIDYLDILKMETGDRHDIDLLWKQFKRITAKLNILVVTADQSNKLTYEKDITLGDTSEDKRKNAHLDIKVGLNQKPEEKEAGIMRFNLLKHRHKGFNPYAEVMVLQQLELGQPLLDSEYINKPKQDKKRREK